MTFLYCRWTECREGLEGGATRTRGAYTTTKNVGTCAPPAGQGIDVEAAFDFGDFFDRDGNRSLRMKFAQELL